MAGVVTFGLLLTILCICVSKLPTSGDVIYASFQFSVETNVKLTGSVLSESRAVSSAVRCSVLCRRTALCRSFNYDKTEKHCQLNQETKNIRPGGAFQDNNYNYYEMEKHVTNKNKTEEEPTIMEQTGTDETTEHCTTEKLATLEQTIKELTTENPTTKEPSTWEQTTEQPTTEEPTTKEPTNLDPTTEQPTSEEPTTKEPTTLVPTTEQPTSVEPTTEELNLTTENLSTLEPSTEIAVYPPTCSAIKLSGKTQDGSYMIDPDGLGNHPPFIVFCNQMNGRDGMTNIPHTRSGDIIAVDSDPCDVNIVYSVPMEQIVSLIDQSTNCYQILKAECKNAKLWDSDNQLAWWVSRDDVRMPNWGGATSLKGCSCYENNGCASGMRCNCGVVPDHWAVDGGPLSDKSMLPVTALHFENVAPPNQLIYRLESLMCITLVL